MSHKHLVSLNISHKDATASLDHPRLVISLYLTEMCSPFSCVWHRLLQYVAEEDHMQLTICYQEMSISDLKW